ncbi:hypothetical protein HY095_05620 [Candidatus Micrarchaeota archaeon]|nr:hypothetical protein [Candidatus Micrarchaeota archaeon]
MLAATQFGAASLASKAVFSFIIGAILYVSFRDAIPQGKAGRPADFVLGAVVMYLLLST